MASYLSVEDSKGMMLLLVYFVVSARFYGIFIFYLLVDLCSCLTAKNYYQRIKNVPFYGISIPVISKAPSIYGPLEIRMNIFL